MSKHQGKIVVLHLAFRYPFAGVVWQLLHHLVGLERLGFEVHYLEDHGAYVYDPFQNSPVPDARANVARVAPILERFGFGTRWAFIDPVSRQYLGMDEARCAQLLRDADAVINLCAASLPREEHLHTSRFVYLETDPGHFQINLTRGEARARMLAKCHDFFFTYAENLGASDCLLPSGPMAWHHTRPPVLLDIWHPGVGPQEPALFTSVGTWANNGKDCELGGERYYWSKHVNFKQMLEVPGLAGTSVELATDLARGPNYERARAGGFRFRPVIPMSLDLEPYREYISSSRGEFTVAKDIYVRTRSGWFSDRTACYLAAGRPVVTQFTGFEKYLPTGAGLLGFNSAAEAVEALRAVNADYSRHARAARELAQEYFDATKTLDELVSALGL